MQNNVNQKTYFIYVRSTGEKVPVTKIQHDSFYKEADRIRHKEQDHGRCMCSYRFIWKCDGDCIGCEYHAAGDTTSLDQPLPDGNGTLGDYIPDSSKPIDEVSADTLSPDGIQARLEELQKELIKKANNKQDYDAIADEIFRLREQKEQSEVDSHHREETMNRIKELQSFIAKQKTDITEFDEALVKKLIKKVTVFTDHFTVEFKSGLAIEIEA